MSEKRIPVTGGCLCGAIRYEVTDPPFDGGYCHCKTCRKAYGGLFGVWLGFKRAGFRITKGELRFYRTSELAQRGFCETCGSPVMYAYDGSEGYGINAGSLDHPEDWPLMDGTSFGHGFVDSKVPWHTIGDELPRYPQGTKHHDAALDRADGSDQRD